MNKCPERNLYYKIDINKHDKSVHGKIKNHCFDIVLADDLYWNNCELNANVKKKYRRLSTEFHAMFLQARRRCVTNEKGELFVFVWYFLWYFL